MQSDCKGKKIEIGLVLDEMRKKNKSYEPSPEDIATIRKIKAICNSDYTNQSFYGNAALNRKILLDPRISSLLTPQTILAILAMHNAAYQKGELYGSDIGINRNSPGHISLAAVLFYGFSEGLDVIKFMPNNERDYGVRSYQQQKRNYDEYTAKIINNIFEAAKLLDIDVHQPCFQSRDEDETSLLLSFNQLARTIKRLKHLGYKYNLLYVPNYREDEIRSQSIEGFFAICKTLKIKYKRPLFNDENIEITTPMTLEEFVNKFINSDEAILNGTVSHLFYDRVHLEACILENIKITIGGHKYTLEDILREMIRQCDERQGSEIAREQFRIRLKQVDYHLKQKFTKYCEPNEKDKIHLPLQYIRILNLIYSLQVKLNNEIWSCDIKDEKNAKNYVYEINFLKKILSLYENDEKKSTFKSYTLKAAETYVDAIDLLLLEDDTFICDILSHQLAEDEYVHQQGPRSKNQATIELEKLIHALLDDYQRLNCSTNILGEFEIVIDRQYFNITQILAHQPDFEQVQLTEDHLKRYAQFILNRASHKPNHLVDCLLHVTPPGIENVDRAETAHLHYGEKLANGLYSWEFVRDIQYFLRYKKIKPTDSLFSPNLNTLVPEILLCAAVATHGLSKPQGNYDTVHESVGTRWSYKKEYSSPSLPFFKARVASKDKGHPIREYGFTSTSETNDYHYIKESMSNTLMIFHDEECPHSISKKVASISHMPSENEIIYRPGEQFQCTDYLTYKDKHFFALRPLRAINDLDAIDYSPLSMAKHELEIIDKLLENCLKQESSSSIFNFFTGLSEETNIHLMNAKEQCSMLLNIIQDGEMPKMEYLVDIEAEIERLRIAHKKQNVVFDSIIERIDRTIKLAAKHHQTFSTAQL